MNVIFNIVNKKVLIVFPFPWLVTLAQFTMVITCSVAGWMSGTIPSPLDEMTPGFFLEAFTSRGVSCTWQRPGLPCLCDIIGVIYTCGQMHRACVDGGWIFPIDWQ